MNRATRDRKRKIGVTHQEAFLDNPVVRKKKKRAIKEGN